MFLLKEFLVCVLLILFWMAASADTAAGNGNGNSNGQEGTGNANGATSNGLSVPENSVMGPTQAALRHNPGISVDWTPEEQSRLEELLAMLVPFLFPFLYLICFLAC